MKQAKQNNNDIKADISDINKVEKIKRAFFSKQLSRKTTIKDTAILHELALERGKNRGWYPAEWDINDYEKYLFEAK